MVSALTLTFPFQVILTNKHVIYLWHFSSHPDFHTLMRRTTTQRQDGSYAKQGKRTGAHGHARYACNFISSFLLWLTTTPTLMRRGFLHCVRISILNVAGNNQPIHQTLRHKGHSWHQRDDVAVNHHNHTPRT